MGAQLTPKMTIVPSSDVTVTSSSTRIFYRATGFSSKGLSRVNSYNGGIYDNTMSVLTCSTTHFNLIVGPREKWMVHYWSFSLCCTLLIAAKARTGAASEYTLYYLMTSAAR